MNSKQPNFNAESNWRQLEKIILFMKIQKGVLHLINRGDQIRLLKGSENIPNFKLMHFILFRLRDHKRHGLQLKRTTELPRSVGFRCLPRKLRGILRRRDFLRHLFLPRCDDLRDPIGRSRNNPVFLQLLHLTLLKLYWVFSFFLEKIMACLVGKLRLRTINSWSENIWSSEVYFEYLTKKIIYTGTNKTGTILKRQARKGLREKITIK